MDLTVTINFPDGREIDDVEIECAGLADVPRALERLLFRNRAEDFSSLVIVAVPPSAAVVHHKLDTDDQVFFYEQDFYVLSNFSAFNLRWKGETFPTSEHAYHWEKFDNGVLADAILAAPSAHAAFKLAQSEKWQRRDDWDDVKVDIMRNILRAKVVQHEYVRRKLLATGDRELVEDSWRDDFWGWGAKRDGQNMLGRLWMEIRAELRAADAPKPAHDLGGRTPGHDAAGNYSTAQMMRDEMYGGDTSQPLFD